MKKSIVLAMAVVAAMGLSAVCHAGFGLPKAKSPVASSTKTTTESASASIDFTDLNDRQGKVLTNLQNGLVAELAGYYVLKNAVGMDTQNIVAAQTNLKADPKKNASKITKELEGENKALAQKIDTVAKGEDVAAKEKLSNAIADAKAFKNLAYAEFGLVLLDAPKLVKDATSLTSGVKDLTVMNKAKGIISTANQAGKLVPAAKKAFDALNGAIGDAETAVGTKPVKESSAAKEQIKDIFGM
ncbi:MAG: hypothetical protein Q4D21_10415 [Phascolarctobacterium sp.]|nr:hypothetical protein [Phascolarctobacterium sp.]